MDIPNFTVYLFFIYFFKNRITKNKISVVLLRQKAGDKMPRNKLTEEEKIESKRKRAEYLREYRKNNLEKIRETNRNYYHRQKAKMSQEQEVQQ